MFTKLIVCFLLLQNQQVSPCLQTQDQEVTPTLQETVELIESASPQYLPRLFSRVASSREVSEKEVLVLLPFLADQRNALNVAISDNTRVSRFASDTLVEIGEVAVPSLVTFFKETKDDEAKTDRRTRVWCRGRGQVDL